jgi:HPt (histidine-containing phosphotransfer) domain-containing protein
LRQRSLARKLIVTEWMSKMSPKIIVKVDPELQEITPGFLENKKKELIDLQTALEERRLNDIVRIGHKIKGNAGSYGFVALGAIGANLEEAAKAANEVLCQTLISEIAQYLSNVEVVYES